MQMLKIEQLLVRYLAIITYVATMGNRDCQKNEWVISQIAENSKSSTLVGGFNPS